MLHRNNGFTVLELLVAMGLFAMIALPLSVFTFKGMASYQYLQAESNTSTDLGTLSARIGKVVRGATSIVDAEPNTLTIFGYFSPQDTVVKKIRYFIAGTDLNIGVTPPSGSAPNYTYNAAQEVVTTTRIDLAMGSTPMFTYYDDADNLLASGYALSQIKAIGIYVAANPATGQVNVPISVQTRVTLRNFKTNL